MSNFLVYQLYMLQLVNYELDRYFPLLWNKGFYFPAQSLRKSIVWTAKSKGIFALALILTAAAVYLGFTQSIIWAVLILMFCLLFMPLIYSLIVILIWPFDYLAKGSVINQAKQKVRSSKAKVIGIAGSYGKTTMKNVIGAVLSKNLNTIVTPDSVNTPVGISRWINQNLKSDTEVVIVEMGEHYRGDIKYLCQITPPDFAVVTGINEAHLERLKNIEGAIATIFEVLEFAKKDAVILLNKNDKNVNQNYSRFLKKQKPLFFSTEVKAKFNQEELVWQADLLCLKNIKIPLLGKYAIADAGCAIQIAKKLSLTNEQIKAGLAEIKPVEHRLQPIKGAGGVLVIDDSYNGNPDGAKEAIETLKRFTGRKFYITPGLVETGNKAEEVHKQIGHQLAKVADKVMLIKNSVTPYIAEGLKEQKFAESDVIWFDSAPEAHQSLGNYLKEGDIILFQNDWSDEYL